MALLGFGDRIRRALVDKASQIGRRYTNREFAREMGVSDSAITEWISERSEPSITTFRAMAKVTGKSAEWLMALDLEPAEGAAVKIGEPLPRSPQKKAAKAVKGRRRASGDK